MYRSQKVVDFNNIRQNLKLRRMPIFRIVIPCLLFLVISDKLTFNSILSNFNTMQFQSPESIFMGAINISRIVSLNYSLAFGIGYLFVELAAYVAVAIAVLAIIKFLFGFEVVEEKRVEASSFEHNFQSNDIYLKTSKFIC
jgi:hypothetical protein